MRKKLFNIRIIDMKIIEFKHEAVNKKEALESAKYVKEDSDILKHPEVKAMEKYETVYEIKRIRKGNK